eukprot:53641-Eustigmatos_ZCMA.PRE.1
MPFCDVWTHMVFHGLLDSLIPLFHLLLGLPSVFAVCIRLVCDICRGARNRCSNDQSRRGSHDAPDLPKLVTSTTEPAAAAAIQPVASRPS